MLNKLTFRLISHRYFIALYVKLIYIMIISYNTHICMWSYNHKDNLFNIITYKTNLYAISM